MDSLLRPDGTDGGLRWRRDAEAPVTKDTHQANTPILGRRCRWREHGHLWRRRVGDFFFLCCRNSSCERTV